jgi:cytochrome c553
MIPGKDAVDRRTHFFLYSDFEFRSGTANSLNCHARQSRKIIHMPKERLATASKHLHDAVIAIVVLSSFVLPAIAGETIDTRLVICGSCHGADGKPADPSIPIIWGQQQRYLEKQLRDYKSGDRGSQIMSSMAEGLRTDEISEVAASFAGKNWPRQHGGSGYRPPDATSACQTCHGEDFLGGAVTGTVAPRLAGQSQEYLVDAMHSFASGERDNNPEMSTLMKGLSAAEREALAHYLSGL